MWQENQRNKIFKKSLSSQTQTPPPQKQTTPPTPSGKLLQAACAIADGTLRTQREVESSVNNA